MAWPAGIDPGIDPSVPSPAWIYDYYLGGKDNFAADREAAEKALSVVPQGREVAWSNRRFLIRAVRYMASHGVAQFIDLGTGFPTPPSVHETAAALVDGPRVVYVDNDPMVTCHNRALLAGDQDGVAVPHGGISAAPGRFSSKMTCGRRSTSVGPLASCSSRSCISYRVRTTRRAA